MKRECGTCTKCCEGWLPGQALGYTFYQGKPCHFISVGNGCTVYSKRPKEPCVSYKCSWLTNEAIPEWMKPSEINTIIDERIDNGIQYLSVNEAGSKLDSAVLTWLIEYALANQINLIWCVDGGKHWIGSPEFSLLMEELNLPKGK